MIHGRYTLLSEDPLKTFMFTPDDGECSLCSTAGPVFHINNTVEMKYLFSICEHCCKEIAEAFKDGTEI